MLWNAFSPFVGQVARGETAKVRNVLKQAFDYAYGDMTLVDKSRGRTIPSALRELLETRCTSMRLSPLLVCMSVYMVLTTDTSTSPPRGFDKKGHVDIATALLRYGARPDAKDVTGKTIVHYGASSIATLESLLIVEYCIAAARVSAYYGKVVIVDGLQANPELNGKSVLLTGFDGRVDDASSSFQRSMVLPKDKCL